MSGGPELSFLRAFFDLVIETLVPGFGKNAIERRVLKIARPDALELSDGVRDSYDPLLALFLPRR
jgi:hypothetical protein